MRLIPIPRPSFRIYATAALMTGASIAFINCVFQPFGTQNFHHPYKYWILSGYGVVVSLAVMAYYACSVFLRSKKKVAQWNIALETLDFFFSICFGLLSAYLYFLIVYSRPFRTIELFGFMGSAIAISLLPVGMLAIALIYQYRNYYRSQLEIGGPDDQSDPSKKTIILTGSNKKEKLHTSESHIIYIKAEDNYVTLYLDHPDTGTQMHMIRSTLKNIHAQLSGDIFQPVHRSYVVNKNRIIKATGNKNNTKLLLTGTTKTVPVSRSYVDQVRDII